MLKKFVLGSMVVVAALLGNACGDDGSSDSPAGPADSEATLSSSSICEDCDDASSSSAKSSSSVRSSSSVTPQNVTLSEAEGSSSSETGVSSSSAKLSSSSAKVEDSSSSAKVDESSSSVKSAESSSSVKVEESSSSEKNEISSSSEKPVESSSSEKVVESSSSEKSSSSAGIPSKLYDCEKYKCVTTKYLNPDIEYGEYLDVRDSQVYRTVLIGEQMWMAQNLNYKTERSYCWKNNEDSCLIYGRYYPFSVAMDSINQGGCGYGEGCKKNERHQGICPDGWHLPDSLEIAQFLIYIKNRYASDSVNAIKSTFTWKSSYAGTNASGFSLLYTGRVIFGSDGYHSSDHKLDKAYIWGNGWTKIESNGFDYYFGGTFGIQQNVLFFLYEFDANTVVWGLDMIDKDAYNIRCLKDD